MAECDLPIIMCTITQLHFRYKVVSYVLFGSDENVIRRKRHPGFNFLARIDLIGFIMSPRMRHAPCAGCKAVKSKTTRILF